MLVHVPSYNLTFISQSSEIFDQIDSLSASSVVISSDYYVWAVRFADWLKVNNYRHLQKFDNLEKKVVVFGSILNPDRKVIFSHPDNFETFVNWYKHFFVEDNERADL